MRRPFEQPDSAPKANSALTAKLAERQCATEEADKSLAKRGMGLPRDQGPPGIAGAKARKPTIAKQSVRADGLWTQRQRMPSEPGVHRWESQP